MVQQALYQPHERQLQALYKCVTTGNTLQDVATYYNKKKIPWIFIFTSVLMPFATVLGGDVPG